MATRKVLFVLSLALLINPALHCMDTDITDVSKILITAQRSTGPYKFFEKMNSILKAYGIVDGSTTNEKLDDLHLQATVEYIQASKRYIQCSKAYIKIGEECINVHEQLIQVNNQESVVDKMKTYLGSYLGGDSKSRVERLTDSYKNLEDSYKKAKDCCDEEKYYTGLRNGYVKYMKDKKIHGIFAFFLPPSTQDGFKGVKMFVVNSDEKKYQALWLHDSYRYEAGWTGPSVDDIGKEFFTIGKGLHGGHGFIHFVLATKNISNKALLMEKLRRNTIRHAMITQNQQLLSKIKVDGIPEEKKNEYRSTFILNAKKGLKEYQQGIVETAFQENDSSDRAVFVIPSHGSYKFTRSDLYCDSKEDKKQEELGLYHGSTAQKKADENSNKLNSISTHDSYYFKIPFKE